MEITSGPSLNLNTNSTQTIQNQDNTSQAPSTFSEEDTVSISPEAVNLANSSFTDPNENNDDIVPAPGYP